MSATREALVQAEDTGLIPKAARREGKIRARVWHTADLPKIGERYGFLRERLPRTQIVSVFTSKGGVLKTTVAFNLARIAALHNHKTLVIGLDFQCDLSSAIGLYPTDKEVADEELNTLLDKMNQLRGLTDVFRGSVTLDDVIVETDIPTLHAIPETPELNWLDMSLSATTRREYWLKDSVLTELKNRYDLIILDCSPNWNLLTSNAFAACDMLVSPIECAINQYRNLEVFQSMVQGFSKQLRIRPEHVFVPTKVTTAKLSTEIKRWYGAHVNGVTSTFLRWASQGDEALAGHESVIEYAPTSVPATEMRELVSEVWSLLRARTGTQEKAVA